MTQIRNILILHGWESNPREHWYLRAKEKLQKEGYNVYVPEMPGAYFPKKENWVEKIVEYNLDETWAVIGHSLGGVALLRYLENTETKIGKAILIAVPYDQMNFNPIANFFFPEMNFSKIQNKANKFIILNEDEDPVVPLEHGEKYHSHLKSKFIVKKGCLHFDIIDLDFLEKVIEL